MQEEPPSGGPPLLLIWRELHGLFIKSSAKTFNKKVSECFSYSKAAELFIIVPHIDCIFPLGMGRKDLLLYRVQQRGREKCRTCKQHAE